MNDLIDITGEQNVCMKEIVSLLDTIRSPTWAEYPSIMRFAANTTFDAVLQTSFGYSMPTTITRTDTMGPPPSVLYQETLPTERLAPVSSHDMTLDLIVFNMSTSDRGSPGTAMDILTTTKFSDITRLYKIDAKKPIGERVTTFLSLARSLIITCKHYHDSSSDVSTPRQAMWLYKEMYYRMRGQLGKVIEPQNVGCLAYSLALYMLALTLELGQDCSPRILRCNGQGRYVFAIDISGDVSRPDDKVTFIYDVQFPGTPIMCVTVEGREGSSSSTTTGKTRDWYAIESPADRGHLYRKIEGYELSVSWLDVFRYPGQVLAAILSQRASSIVSVSNVVTESPAHYGILRELELYASYLIHTIAYASPSTISPECIATYMKVCEDILMMLVQKHQLGPNTRPESGTHSIAIYGLVVSFIYLTTTVPAFSCFGSTVKCEWMANMFEDDLIPRGTSVPLEPVTMTSFVRMTLDNCICTPAFVRRVAYATVLTGHIVDQDLLMERFDLAEESTGQVDISTRCILETLHESDRYRETMSIEAGSTKVISYKAKQHDAKFGNMEKAIRMMRDEIQHFFGVMAVPSETLVRALNAASIVYRNIDHHIAARHIQNVLFESGCIIAVPKEGKIRVMHKNIDRFLGNIPVLLSFIYKASTLTAESLFHTVFLKEGAIPGHSEAAPIAYATALNLPGYIRPLLKPQKLSNIITKPIGDILYTPRDSDILAALKASTVMPPGVSFPILMSNRMQERLAEFTERYSGATRESGSKGLFPMTIKENADGLYSDDINDIAGIGSCFGGGGTHEKYVCSYCGAADPSFRCAGCKVTLYCGKSCYVSDWNGGHRFHCNQ